VLVSLIDLGERFRLIVNEVECVAQAHDMPKLPVAAVLWKPLPDLSTATEAWMYAGGAHHSVLSYAVTVEDLRDYAEIVGIEFVHIGAHTDVRALRRELAVDDLIWKLR
jgi:L-arabinose isomerase